MLKGRLNTLFTCARGGDDGLDYFRVVDRSARASAPKKHGHAPAILHFWLYFFCFLLRGYTRWTRGRKKSDVLPPLARPKRGASRLGSVCAAAFFSASSRRFRGNRVFLVRLDFLFFRRPTKGTRVPVSATTRTSAGTWRPPSFPASVGAAKQSHTRVPANGECFLFLPDGVEFFCARNKFFGRAKIRGQWSESERASFVFWSVSPRLLSLSFVPRSRPRKDTHTLSHNSHTPRARRPKPRPGRGQFHHTWLSSCAARPPRAATRTKPPWPPAPEAWLRPKPPWRRRLGWRKR